MSTTSVKLLSLVALTPVRHISPVSLTSTRKSIPVSLTPTKQGKIGQRRWADVHCQRRSMDYLYEYCISEKSKSFLGMHIGTRRRCSTKKKPEVKNLVALSRSALPQMYNNPSHLCVHFLFWKQIEIDRADTLVKITIKGTVSRDLGIF